MAEIPRRDRGRRRERVQRAVTAVAGTNIALVKYWGKRDAALNLPATGSLSLTLDRLGTRTTVALRRRRGAIGLSCSTARPPTTPRPRACRRSSTACARAPSIARRALVTSDNSVPTAAGPGVVGVRVRGAGAGGDARRRPDAVAARAVGAGAPRLGLGGALDLRRLRRDGARRARRRQRRRRARAARQARRLGRAPGRRGHRRGPEGDGLDRGDDAHRAHLAVSTPPGSRGVPADLAAARAAIAARDLPALGAVAERSALRMHASALAADPADHLLEPGDAGRDRRRAGAARRAARASSSPSTPARTSRRCAAPPTPTRSPPRCARVPGVSGR